jgi:hypothetical protein
VKSHIKSNDDRNELSPGEESQAEGCEDAHELPRDLFYR